MKKINLFLLSSVFILSVSCSKSLPVSECGNIVTHAKKVLGENAGSEQSLMNDCQNATDAQRGCAMNANNALTLAGCTK